MTLLAKKPSEKYRFKPNQESCARLLPKPTFRKLPAVRYLLQKDWHPLVNEFVELITSRTKYLKSLIELGDDWTSGKSIAPNQNVIDSCITLLDGVQQFVILSNDENVIPRLVIGPIPSGGVLIELHGEDGNSIDISVLNSETKVIVEPCYDFFYQEEEKVRATNVSLVKYLNRLF